MSPIEGYIIAFLTGMAIMAIFYFGNRPPLPPQ
jgi:hypothetical protein